MTYIFQAVYATKAPKFRVHAHCAEYARALARMVAPRALCLILRGTVRS